MHARTARDTVSVEASSEDEDGKVPPSEDLEQVSSNESEEPEANGSLAESTAQITICVAFNAIWVSDVPRNQLKSSAKVLGIKHMDKRQVVAQGLLDQGFIKIKRNLTNPTRDDIVKLKAF
ncbi:hypothetical protein ACROYT_G015510 [Oculina patagonica]